MPRSSLLLLVVSAALLVGCGGTDRASRSSSVAPGPEPVAALPPVPSQDGVLSLQLAYPRPGASRPDADSTFLFGTTGTGRATLRINSLRVPVAANGSFLTYVPVADAYDLMATAGETSDRITFRYGEIVTVDNARPFASPRRAVVISGRDTLAGGSEIVAGRLRPGGDRRWFFPKGARLTVDAELPGTGLVRARLTDSTFAWIDAAALRIQEDAADTSRPLAGPVRLVASPTYVDVRIPADFAPFDVTAETDAVGITVYGREADAGPLDVGGDVFVSGAAWTRAAPDSSRLFLRLGAPLWGYKAFYARDGTLVVRLRRPPRTTPDAPLRQLRVVVDAGHPPGGAIGPTGLTEAEANLAIAQRVAARLRERGATVFMTRTSEAPLENASWTPDELWARVDFAVRSDAHVLVSIHNNAFPDGTNPFDNVGSEVYYFHPFAQGLAQEMVDEIAGVTGLRNKGALRRSLALVRPTWMPAVLTESFYVMFPQQEAALRNPDVLDRLADAHVRALEQFVERRLPQ